MEGVIWHEETLGASFDRVEIPEELVEAAELAREQLIEAVADSDESIMMKFLEGEESGKRSCTRRIRPGRWPSTSCR